jgi:enterochelin esterase-like enzyme
MDLRILVPDWARHVVSDLTDMDRNPVRVDAGKVRAITLDLPDDVYFEYGFLDANGRMRADPDNDQRADNPWYPEASATHGSRYRPDPLAFPDDDLERGTVDRGRLPSAALGGQPRRWVVYTPAGHEGSELPWVIVQDGIAFYRMAKLHLVLEALLRQGEARPARFAFVEPIDRRAEYGFSADFRAFLTDELLMELEKRYGGTGERIWVGASLGGLLSATVGLERPDLVSTVVTFSGAYLGTPKDRDYYDSERSWVLDRLRSGDAAPARWYLDVGTIEWLADANRQVAEALSERGIDHEFRERNAGHNWTNWRNGMSSALRFALRP